MPDRSIGILDPVSHIYPSDKLVVEQSGAAMQCSGQTLITDLAAQLDAHGGIVSIVLTGTSGLEKTYTITYADASTSSFVVTDGAKGDTGARTWIKWAQEYPPVTMLNSPADYIGIAVADSAPASYTGYSWYKYKGEKGDRGYSITSVTYTSSQANVDTYTVSFDDGTTTTFNVTNGTSIVSITLTSSSGLTDVYTVLLTDGSTTTFSVSNGNGIESISYDHSSHGAAKGTAGETDYYLITFTDGDTFMFEVYNGTNGAGAVSSVDGIQAVGQDVPLLTIGNGAPTTATVGAVKSRYFDSNASVLYICTGVDTSTTPATYTWRGAGVTVDSNLSSSSTNPVQNRVITGKVGTAALNTTAQNLSGAINELKSNVGSMSLNTTATDLTGAVNELDGRADAVDVLLGSNPMPQATVTGSIGAINSSLDKKVLYFSNVTVNVSVSSEMFRITDSKITANTVVLECVFMDEDAISSDVTWTSYAGYIAFNGTCTSATTANVTLGERYSL